ncbi:PREDICTED: glucuronoxylan 4-O-methyltransferase 1-like [Camelina sativa]|uniref:Glucuronoxylan 4-O-methyltransferase 1-like n=1 Tax=Camelina sativa TaxID=90675 RepID=A0ABM1R5T9_CAMSA|nr:PREDICTED: glucuronoxylan 4-O-methyltransferase 1-like [Camelina sativa]
MRPKANQSHKLKLLLVCLLATLILIFILRSTLTSSRSRQTPEDRRSERCSGACNKLPRSLAQALIHYSTSVIIPQQTLKEIAVSSSILSKKSPCNFLVFGLGHDSLMWSSLNYGGRTVFLEEDEAWIKQIKRRFPMLESYHVTYDSKVNQADNLIEVGKGPECTAIVDPRYSMCQLALKGLPADIYETSWDLIMVDAPTGYYDEAPGRMTAIYTAGMMARNRKQGGETDVLRSTLTSSRSRQTPEDRRSERCSGACNKLPRSLAQALIHYSTSVIIPQQTLKEIAVSSSILSKKSPCNFLVFGLGHDSLMWSSLNYGGRTVFLEEDEAWIKQIKRRFPMLESYHVTYDSKVNQADNLIEVGKGPECTAIGDPRYSMCQLALKGLPADIYETSWDLIMVDAPTGYYDEAPGRMTAIYTAGMMARNRKQGGETDVFVHDVNREIENKFSKAFLCEGYMKKQEGRLRHFVIPSYRVGSQSESDRLFCP